LTVDQASTILERRGSLTAVLADGTPFGIRLSSLPPDGISDAARLTVTLVEPFVFPFLLGDCNLDGRVTFFDIHPFIDILMDGSFLEQADCNQDGEVNFLDVLVVN